MIDQVGKMSENDSDMNELQKWKSTPIEEMRNQVIEDLKEGYSRDFINQFEFENRIEKAHDASNKFELIALIEDLPETTAKPEPQHPINQGKVKENGVILSIFAGIERRGRWRPARNTKVIASMGGVDLDFTFAELPPGVTTIDILTVMGGVDIVVPDDINVESEGFAIMGGWDENIQQSANDPSKPTLRIRGFAMMAGVEVRTPNKRDRRRHKKFLDE
jgi:hypothetical protein